MDGKLQNDQNAIWFRKDVGGKVEQHFLFHASHLALQHDFSVRLWINYYIYIYTYTYIHITTSRRDVTMHMMVNVRASIPKWPNIPIISIHYCCLVISYRSRIAPCYSLRWPQQGVPDGAGGACQFGPCFETWAMGIYAFKQPKPRKQEPNMGIWVL